MTDKMIEFIVNAVRYEEQVKRERVEEGAKNDLTIPRPLSSFTASRKAGDLIKPCQTKAAHHRERETHYTAKLEEAEKELKEKGVTVEVYDQGTGTFMNPTNAISSGAITGAVAQQFQPRVDQRLMDAVKNVKAKMLDHREKAVQYEKYARAFQLNPEYTIRLSIEDVSYFGLS